MLGYATFTENYGTWADLGKEDKAWARFSTLEIGVSIYVKKFHTCQKQANLKLKTQPNNLLGCVPLAFAFQKINAEPKF